MREGSHGGSKVRLTVARETPGTWLTAMRVSSTTSSAMGQLGAVKVIVTVTG